MNPPPETDNPAFVTQEDLTASYRREVKGHSGGARANTGGARENAGRPSGASDATLSAARLISPAQKWAFAEKALQHAERAIEVLVEIMEHGEAKPRAFSAADKILNRALGKTPQHIDITAASPESAQAEWDTRQLLNRAHF